MIIMNDQNYEWNNDEMNLKQLKELYYSVN